MKKLGIRALCFLSFSLGINASQADEKTRLMQQSPSTVIQIPSAFPVSFVLNPLAVASHPKKLAESKTVSQSHIRHLLRDNGMWLKSGLIEDLGSINELESLDLSKSEAQQKMQRVQTYVTKLEQEIANIKHNEVVNEKILSLVYPRDGSFFGNLLVNSAAYAGCLIWWGLQTKSAPWEFVCFNNNVNTCTSNPVAYNCAPSNQCAHPPYTGCSDSNITAMARCCIAFTDGMCEIQTNQLRKEAHQYNTYTAEVILGGGLATLLFIQLMIQFYRVMLVKPTTQVTRQVIARITEYKDVLQKKLPAPGVGAAQEV